jgi:surface protein
MFAGNPNLTKLDLSNVRFEKLVSANEMFLQCSALTSIDLSGFVSPNVTSYSSMFSSCTALTNVDCSDLKFAENAVSVGIERMFMSCSSLTSIDIRNLKTDKASSTMYMFYGCKKLQHIDMRGLDLTKVTNHNSMFGTSSSNNVPSDCEIIVKDDDSKAWLNSKFSRLTNVKTVAEYEAE